MDRQNYEILRYFLINDTLTYGKLQTQFSLSHGTISKNIQALNAELTGIAQIIFRNGVFFIEIEDYEKLTSIQTSFLKEDLDYNDPVKRQALILKELYRKHDEYVILDDLAEKFLSSRGTINKDIQALRSELNYFGAEIQTKTNRGVKLFVPQDYKYAVIFKSLVARYCELPQLSAQEGLELEEILATFGVTEEVTRQFKTNLLIVLWLRQQGIIMQAPVPHYYFLLKESSCQALQTYLANFFESPLNITEWLFITSPMNISKLRQTEESKLEEAVAELSQLGQGLIPALKKKIDVNLDFCHFFMEIKYHLVFLVNRAAFDIKSNEFISDEILTMYPLALELAKEMVTLLSQKLAENIRDQEIGYLTVYFQMELDATPQNNLHRFAVVNIAGSSINKFIAKQIKALFDEEVIVDTFSSEEEFKASQAKYLLTFTNDYFKDDQLNRKAPVVKLDTAFNKGSLQEKMRILLVNEAIQAGLCQFSVTKFKTSKSYLDEVASLIDREIAQGNLTEEFKESWRQKEAEKSNIFGDGIAIPHLIDDSGHHRILVKAGIFDKAVTYKSRKVKVVFLVAIPKELDDNLTRTLSNVYDAINTMAANANMLSNLKNYDDNRGFIQIMEAI
ncbi:BglG family transcription antiterminator [Ligilactobacillus equi]|uniref:BglG family transcription antiterminator n=1 Tax=Ligilactobacillus equi TaxID=137357 RepID=UPI00046B012D|nr:HTH domain-containing protein [Ligilactobacillus equi]